MIRKWKFDREVVKLVKFSCWNNHFGFFVSFVYLELHLFRYFQIFQCNFYSSTFFPTLFFAFIQVFFVAQMLYIWSMSFCRLKYANKMEYTQMIYNLYVWILTKNKTTTNLETRLSLTAFLLHILLCYTLL